MKCAFLRRALCLSLPTFFGFLGCTGGFTGICNRVTCRIARDVAHVNVPLTTN